MHCYETMSELRSHAPTALFSVARTYNSDYTCVPQYVISASEAGIRHSRTVFGGEQIWVIQSLLQ